MVPIVFGTAPNLPWIALFRLLKSLIFNPVDANLTRVLGYGLQYHATRLGNTIELHFGGVILGLIAS